MKLLVKCPECGSTCVSHIRGVVMEGNDSMKDTADPAILSGFCEDCGARIRFGHLVTINDEQEMVINMEGVEVTN